MAQSTRDAESDHSGSQCNQKSAESVDARSSDAPTVVADADELVVASDFARGPDSMSPAGVSSSSTKAGRSPWICDVRDILKSAQEAQNALRQNRRAGVIANSRVEELALRQDALTAARQRWPRRAPRDRRRPRRHPRAFAPAASTRCSSAARSSRCRCCTTSCCR